MAIELCDSSMATTIAVATIFDPSFFRGKNGTGQEEFFDNITYCQDQSDVYQYVLKQFHFTLRFDRRSMLQYTQKCS